LTTLTSVKGDIDKRKLDGTRAEEIKELSESSARVRARVPV
jgi:hypothetical protein